MGVTKENRRTRNKVNKKQEKKLTIGDIVFRVLVMVAIFFIAVIAYGAYLNGIA